MNEKNPLLSGRFQKVPNAPPITSDSRWSPHRPCLALLVPSHSMPAALQWGSVNGKRLRPEWWGAHGGRIGSLAGNVSMMDGSASWAIFNSFPGSQGLLGRRA